MHPFEKTTIVDDCQMGRLGLASKHGPGKSSAEDLARSGAAAGFPVAKIMHTQCL